MKNFLTGKSTTYQMTPVLSAAYWSGIRTPPRSSSLFGSRAGELVHTHLQSTMDSKEHYFLSALRGLKRIYNLLTACNFSITKPQKIQWTLKWKTLPFQREIKNSRDYQIYFTVNVQIPGRKEKKLY
jgi:hypothetical protein